jgi:RecJ-like exonuclease
MGLSRRISAIPRNFKVGETWVLLAHPKAMSEPGTESCPSCNGAGEVSEESEDHTPTDRGDEVRTTTVEVKCDRCDGKGTLDVTVSVPGIFTLWKPSRIEKICKESERNSEAVAKLIEQGITPVFVPDDDKDHAGTVYDKEEEEEAETSNNHVAA